MKAITLTRKLYTHKRFLFPFSDWHYYADPLSSSFRQTPADEAFPPSIRLLSFPSPWLPLGITLLTLFHNTPDSLSRQPDTVWTHLFSFSSARFRPGHLRQNSYLPARTQWNYWTRRSQTANLAFASDARALRTTPSWRWNRQPCWFPQSLLTLGLRGGIFLRRELLPPWIERSTDLIPCWWPAGCWRAKLKHRDPKRTPR